MGQVQPGEEGDALADYLKQLEARIATYPTQAVAHLLWPSYEPPAAGASRPPSPGPSRPLASAAATRRRESEETLPIANE